MTLGDWLKEVRDHQGMSQKDLAEMCNISLPMISYIENGKRAGRRTLQKLSLAMQVDYVFLREMNVLQSRERKE
jgi:transcriptional regulator with XRE-family HTH domain